MGEELVVRFLAALEDGDIDTLREIYAPDAGVAEHDRIVVHVHHPRGRSHPLSDLVRVVRRRQPGPDVQELPDTRLGDQEVHRRARNARWARTATSTSGYAAATCSATARSAAKLSLPPSQKSYTRAI
jgi:ketosteroid isomerase-like protein